MLAAIPDRVNAKLDVKQVKLERQIARATRRD
jgi:hypothetical protein